jgi:hypothetical protein
MHHPGYFAVALALAALAPHAALAQSTSHAAPAAMVPAAHTPVHTSGTLSHYILSPLGRVRGLVLDGSTVVFLHGRAAQSMPSQASPGAVLEVDGYALSGQRSTIHGATVRDVNGHVLLAAPLASTDHPPPPDATRRARLDRVRNQARSRLEQLPSVTVSGTVQSVLRDRAGNVDGVLLSDGTSVAVGRRLGRQLRAHGLRTGDALRVTGQGRNYPAGESVQAVDVQFSDGVSVHVPV